MKEFRPLNPLDVIDAAAEKDFCRVVVIGVYRNGRIYAASSHSVGKFYDDLEKAKAHVDSLAVPIEELDEDDVAEALPSAVPCDP